MEYRRCFAEIRGLLFVFFVLHCAHGDLTYSVQEELKHGSVIGNIAKDLGLDSGRLSARKARVEMEGSDKQYVGINPRNGDLFVSGRIDREEHCGEKPTYGVEWSGVDRTACYSTLEKELQVDYRTKISPHPPPHNFINIQGTKVEPVDCYNYLMGIHLDNKLDWIANTNAIYKKGQTALRCGLALVFLSLRLVRGDVSFSVPEEMKRGSVIGNIAKDLGLDLGALSARKARIDTEDNGNRKRYCDINFSSGDLIVTDRIDREELCGEKLSCVIKRDLVLENPLELHPFSLHIHDINDNEPQFNEGPFNIEIAESAVRGARFVIEEAHDADVGQNSVQQYRLEKNDHFILSADGSTLELVLDKELDREKQNQLKLILTALDGGAPQRSGTAVIHVSVLDANDNAPVFSQAVYKASLPENSPLDTVVVTVSATDADEGVNGDVSYDFGHVSEEVKKVFSIDRKKGEIKLVSKIDFETVTNYDLRIKAKDGLGLSTYTKVIIDVIDVNDNEPVIYVKSMTNPVPENILPGTEVGIINVQDADSENNQQVRCSIQQNVPFKLLPAL
ncbi:protocadherin gamma-B4, partial [Nematolebias whitei]|uniref:protocadherin gamma-B4 n=1 Tax=Nematolebias whitei TaxID=451745 RepID=UPI00189C0023